MAGSKVLPSILLISFMIFSTHALTVFLSNGKGAKGFNCETEIVRAGEKRMGHSNGSAKNKTFKIGPATRKVIVYISKNYDELKGIAFSQKCEEKRAEITKVLGAQKYEMLYLGVADFCRGDERLIGEFLFHSIKFDARVNNFFVDIIEEVDSNLIYRTPYHVLHKYKEDKQIFEGNLLGQLGSMKA